MIHPSTTLPPWLLHLLLIGIHVALVSTSTTKLTKVNIDLSLIPAPLFTDVSSPTLPVCALLASSSTNDLAYNEAEKKCRLIDIEPTTYIRRTATEGWTGWTTQVDATPCPEPYKMVVGLGCIYLESDNLVLFDDVMTTCFMGGKPISPPTNDAFLLLKAYLLSLGPSAVKSYHVGMHPKDGTGVFRWFDGHTITANATIFGTQEPNGDGDCFAVTYVPRFGFYFDLTDTKCIKLWGTVCHLG